jgi:hypothetical protein
MIEQAKKPLTSSKRKGLSNASLKARVEDYSGELLKFREWCRDQDVDFKQTVVKALEAYKAGNAAR